MGFVEYCVCDYCGRRCSGGRDAIQVRCEEVCVGGKSIWPEANADEEATIMCRACWKARISDGWGAKEVKP